MDPEDHRRWWKSEGARQLREILLSDWDPIGINGVPEAVSEYDGYLGPIANRLREGANAEAMAGYLAEIQSDRMGLPTSSGELLGVANDIVDWYAKSHG